MLPKLTTKPATRRWRSSAQITGNFTEPDNCAGPLAVGHGCTANVSFTPTANGASNGSISFTDNFAPRTQVLPVTWMRRTAGLFDVSGSEFQFD
jgi:hypothetical protein